MCERGRKFAHWLVAIGKHKQGEVDLPKEYPKVRWESLYGSALTDCSK